MSNEQFWIMLVAFAVAVFFIVRALAGIEDRLREISRFMADIRANEGTKELNAETFGPNAPH